MPKRADGAGRIAPTGAIACGKAPRQEDGKTRIPLGDIPAVTGAADRKRPIRTGEARKESGPAERVQRDMTNPRGGHAIREGRTDRARTEAIPGALTGAGRRAETKSKIEAAAEGFAIV